MLTTTDTMGKRTGLVKRLLQVLGTGLVLGLVRPAGQRRNRRTGEGRPEVRFHQADRHGPLAIAYEKGYFEDEGLYVTLEAQANWKVLLDGVIDGRLDEAHMLAGQPLAATIGFGTKADIVTPFSMDLNGNGITLSNEVWELMKAHVPMGACRRQAGASDRGRCPQTGGGAVQEGRQALQDGHGVSGLHPQL